VNFYVGADKKSLDKMGMIVDELDISIVPNKEIDRRINSADYIFGGWQYIFLITRTSLFWRGQVNYRTH
jgi:peptidase E